jgi:predicted nucleic acid-binding protein
MIVEAFLDTNIILYAASQSALDTQKQGVAFDLLTTSNFGTSAQVLQEFYSVATRKWAKPMAHDDALDWLENFENVPCVPIDISLVHQGAETAHRHKVSYWDGAIIAAAERLGAQILYTEDLNHGQKYGSVTAINPFKAN